MTTIRSKVYAAIDKCIVTGDNLGFFGKQELDAGKRLGNALELYNLVKDSVEGQLVLKSDLRVAGQQRVTSNIALVVTKLVLKPNTPSHEKACSDYARVFEFLANAGATPEQIVDVFSNGEFKTKLQEARENSPKRKIAARDREHDGGELQIILKRVGSAKTILRFRRVAQGVDVTDEHQLHDLVLSMLASAPNDSQSMRTKQPSVAE